MASKPAEELERLLARQAATPTGAAPGGSSHTPAAPGLTLSPPGSDGGSAGERLPDAPGRQVPMLRPPTAAPGVFAQSSHGGIGPTGAHPP